MKEYLVWFTCKGAFEQENFLVLNSFRKLLFWFLRNARRCSTILIEYL